MLDCFTSDFVCTENQLISHPLSNLAAVSDYDIYHNTTEIKAPVSRHEHRCNNKMVIKTEYIIW
jgi:hypothetical protein